MAQNLTENWQIDKILTDNWNLPPPSRPSNQALRLSFLKRWQYNGILMALIHLYTLFLAGYSLSPFIHLLYFQLKTWRPCWFTRANFSQALSLKSVTPNFLFFFYISGTSKTLTLCIWIFKKIYWIENFRLNVLLKHHLFGYVLPLPSAISYLKFPDNKKTLNSFSGEE